MTPFKVIDFSDTGLGIKAKGKCPYAVDQHVGIEAADRDGKDYSGFYRVAWISQVEYNFWKAGLEKL